MLLRSLVKMLIGAVANVVKEGEVTKLDDFIVMELFRLLKGLTWVRFKVTTNIEFKDGGFNRCKVGVSGVVDYMF